MLKHVHKVIFFYKNTNASQICVALLAKRGLDHNMTQFDTMEQALLLLALCLAVCMINFDSNWLQQYLCLFMGRLRDFFPV